MRPSGATAAIAVGAFAAFAGVTVSAQTLAPAGAPLVRALADCRALTADAARLACYDAATSRLVAAERAGEVVVVDREQARAARRQAFGFNLPSLNIFRGGDREPEIERVALVLARAYQTGDGKWVMRTQDGQVWRQTDDHDLRREPGPGSRAEVRRAALGSFFMNVDGQRAIRVRREE